MICFGTIAFTSGTIVYSFLPETLGNPLPETISEAIGGENSSMEISVDDQADENTPLLAWLKWSVFYLRKCFWYDIIYLECDFQN